MQTFNCVRRPRAPPLARRQSSEGEQAVAGFLQAVGDGTVLKPPFADEGLAAALDPFAGRRIDHVGIVSGNLLVQALGCVGEQVPMLVDGASLNRNVIPDGSNRLFQPQERRRR